MTKAKSVHSTQRTIAPKFHQAAKRLPNPPERPLVDVDTFPDLYCLTLVGACLDPLIPDGASVVIQKSASYKVGDVVCIWWRPGFVKPGMYQGWLKRVRLNAPPWVKKFPYSDHPESDVKAIIVKEQLNPPGTYAVPCEHIHAIHKAVGYSPPAKPVERSVRIDCRRSAMTSCLSSASADKLASDTARRSRPAGFLFPFSIWGI